LLLVQHPIEVACLRHMMPGQRPQSDMYKQQCHQPTQSLRCRLCCKPSSEDVPAVEFVCSQSVM
jgi:cytochrome c-type biogenesis protein CcmH/NrfF